MPMMPIPMHAVCNRHWLQQKFGRDSKTVTKLTGEKMGTQKTPLEIIDLGRMPYDEAFNLQKEMVQHKIAGQTMDRLLFVEHPPVISIGRSGNSNDLRLSEALLAKRGISVFQSDRGGKATFHEPGQLVAYPIITLKRKDLKWYVGAMLDILISILECYGLTPRLKQGNPGIWIEDRKIASIGIAVKEWVSMHGIALNINNDLTGFDCIIPCGNPKQIMTSMQKELHYTINTAEVKALFASHFKKKFDFQEAVEKPKPEWLTVSSRQSRPARGVKSVVDELNLNTVCSSAHCPNLSECFNRGTATFMILGERCTRNCRFCAVKKGSPLEPDLREPENVAKAVKKLGLTYSVITSVTRDDLHDGGAEQFAETIRQIRRLCKDTRVEVLVSDLSGSLTAINTVCRAKPDMFNHNMETVRRLYPEVRSQADYERSLYVLQSAAAWGLSVKSGLMLGLGELNHEIIETLKDLRKAGCTYLTLGQYLSPSKNHYPVARYLHPDEFAALKDIAFSMGFVDVASGPLVRSSYRAEQFFRTINETKSEQRLAILLDG